MATSPPSSVKSEPTGVLYTAHEPNLLYTSIYDTSIDNNLPTQTEAIEIEPQNRPSNGLPFDNLQGFSAPPSTVYINMGENARRSNDVTFAGPISRNDQPLSRSLAAIDTDQPIAPPTLERHSSTHGQHHHHFSHHSQNRNRYPYLQRPISTRALYGTNAPRSSLEGISYFEHRPAFRRSYFAVRKHKIPKAPPMPRHLYPGYRQDQTASSRVESSGDHAGSEEEDEDQPPAKSFWIILRLVFFFFAIEFMYAVETALTIPIFSALRVPETFFSMAWLISPILGFFLQPIIGMWSDTCKCRWGRRRPFVLAFAIGAYIGVTLLLNGSDLGVALGDSTDLKTVPYKAVILTAIGVTFLDFCADSADAPIRAYLIDTTNQADQERGFNIHAILGGFGGGLGYTIGAIQWPWIPMFRTDGGEFSIVFYVASFLFIFCTISTLTSIPEEPLISSSSSSSSTRTNGEVGNSYDDDNDNDDDQPEIEVDEKRPLLSLRRNNPRSSNSTAKPLRSTASAIFRELNSQEGFVEIDPGTGKHIPHDHVDGTGGNILLQTLERSHQVVAASMSADPSNPVPIPTQAFEAELRQKAKLVKLGLMRRPASEDSDDYDDKDNVTIKSMLISMLRMPSRLWKLMLCQVIGWIGYFATHLYFTDFMATDVYHGSMDNTSDIEAFDKYKQGVAMGCWGLFLYSASSGFYAFCLERWLAERFSLKTLYFVGYVAYVVGCLVDYFVQQYIVNVIMCFTFGMLVVSLNTIPYHMLSQFHADETYRNSDGTKRGIGVDCSLLNSCYFLGELIVAVSLGPILEHTGVRFCMIIGAVFTAFGNVVMFFLFFFKT